VRRRDALAAPSVVAPESDQSPSRAARHRLSAAVLTFVASPAAAACCNGATSFATRRQRAGRGDWHDPPRRQPMKEQRHPFPAAAAGGARGPGRPQPRPSLDVEPRGRPPVADARAGDLGAHAQSLAGPAERGPQRLDELAGDDSFVAELRRLGASRNEYLDRTTWFAREHPTPRPPSPTSAWSTASPRRCRSIPAASACSRATT